MLRSSGVREIRTRDGRVTLGGATVRRVDVLASNGITDVNDRVLIH